ncbi:MAG: VOC family protein [Gemmatimonadaceae bacterium]
MTNVTQPAPSLLVIYAQDIARVAEFYERTLSRPVMEQDARFIVVGDSAMEVAIVRMPEALVAANPLGSPPRVREETPLKPSFLVDDLDGVVAAAAATGGGTKPITAAWQWRGQLHLDGHDPEGNPVQFRTRAAVSRAHG